MSRSFSCILAAVLWLMLAPVDAEAMLDRHPQDGPHADVRIAIADNEVRFNIGFNLPFVDEAAPTIREVSDTIDPAESPVVESALMEYLRTQHAVVVDGIEVPPRFESVVITRIDDAMLGLFPNMGRSALTRLSVVAVYPFNTEPKEIRMKWGAFPGDVLSVGLEGPAEELPPLIVQAQLKAEGRIQMVMFSESEPWVIWRPTGTEIADILEPLPAVALSGGTAIPVISIALVFLGAFGALAFAAKDRKTAGASLGITMLFVAILAKDTGTVHLNEATLTPEQAASVFGPLHANVYRAFDYSSEDDVYDALARSVSGDLLRDLYSQIRLGLRQAENEGAIGRVTDVQLRSTQVEKLGVGENSDGFDMRAAWEVEGTVYHFGHSHAKRRAFEAVFRVEPGEDGWRITRADPVDVTDIRPTEL